MALVLPAQPTLAATAETALPDTAQEAVLVDAERALVGITNADRTSNALDALQLDGDVLGIARERAESQIGLSTLSHDDADGTMVFVRVFAEAGITYNLAGENIARTPLDPAVIERVEHALMQSPLHRRNILEPRFNRLAVGAALDSTGEIIFDELFLD
jgi:uncharacterized protein YkwD